MSLSRSAQLEQHLDPSDRLVPDGPDGLGGEVDLHRGPLELVGRHQRRGFMPPSAAMKPSGIRCRRVL